MVLSCVGQDYVDTECRAVDWADEDYAKIVDVVDRRRKWFESVFPNVPFSINDEHCRIIIEVTYDIENGRWTFEKERPDKQLPNHVSVVMDTMEVCGCVRYPRTKESERVCVCECFSLDSPCVHTCHRRSQRILSKRNYSIEFNAQQSKMIGVLDCTSSFKLLVVGNYGAAAAAPAPPAQVRV